MRLTKVTKKAIVRSIMNDVLKFVTNDKEGKQQIQDALVAAMSPEARKLYKQNPKALREKYVTAWSVGFDSSFEVIVGDADIDDAIKPFVDAYKAREELRHKLEGIVEGCSTTKQLLALAPEFEKYIPQEAAPSKNLPAVANVVADLTKMGWPKKGEQA